MDEELKTYLQGMEDRTAALIAGELGNLHTDLQQAEARLGARLDSIDSRLKLQAGLIQSGARAMARFKEASESGGLARPRDVIAAILAEALPADDERRTFNVIYTAYLALSLTDPALAIAPLVKNSDAVIDVVAAQLRAAQAAGDTPAHLDARMEALSLVAMASGLATSVLAGQSSLEQVQAAVDYHLGRLFPAA